MLNPQLKLNPHLFDADVSQAPIRAGFGEGLVQAGERDGRIVALCADLTESTKMNAFAEKFPDRFIQVGIAEQNLASVASGMAAVGKIPFISSYAMFSPGRNWEQIRTTICYNDVPVKIAGSHAGVSVGPDGGTHQALEDIALTRVIPNMTVIVPCDAIEARKATLAMAQTSSPTYLRLAREKTPLITTDETPFEIGKAATLYEQESPDVGIIVCGGLTHTALCAARELGNEGISAVVVNMHTIKPMDRDAVVRLARLTRALVTVEEHQLAGGMGSAVAEILAEEFPVPIEFVAVRDEFGQSGTPEQLLHHYHLDLDTIKNAARDVLKRSS